MSLSEALSQTSPQAPDSPAPHTTAPAPRRSACISQTRTHGRACKHSRTPLQPLATITTGWANHFNATYASSTALTVSGNEYLTGTPNAVLSTNANGQVVATTSIGTNYLTGVLGTVNGTSFSEGGSITVAAASSTLLANNNTFSGINVFTGNATFTNATSTNFFSTTASSTNLFAQTAAVGSLQASGNATVVGIVSVGSGGGTQTIRRGIAVPANRRRMCQPLWPDQEMEAIWISGAGGAVSGIGGSVFLHPGFGSGGAGNVLIGIDSSGNPYINKDRYRHVFSVC